MENVITYYVKDYKLSEVHKQRISESMKRHFAAHPVTIEHRRKISEGAKRTWKERKQYWREQGWI